MTTRVPAPQPGIFSPQFLWTTIGSNALVFLAAFESLAVTTIMPTIVRDLDGQSLYAFAFSGMFASSVIGMVVAGRWADRTGPVGPLFGSIVVFLAGLALCGFAPDMSVFIVGRILQGLGSGAINVALYVVVARIFPAKLHTTIFGAFAAAWVLPSLIGPPVAGIVAEKASWHWVFLGVAALVVVAAATIIPSVRDLRTNPTEPSELTSRRWAVPLSVIVAIGVLVISIGGEPGGWLGWLTALVAFAVVIAAVRPLLPRGTLLARPGLPATILLRGAVAAAFFSAEIYLPYLLGERYGLPPWLAGLILTVGAISWATGSAVQGRRASAASHAAVTRVGTSLVFAGLTVQFLTALLALGPFVAAAGWLVAGFGMGLVFPRISTLLLGYSTERDQGFNSAALSIADATGASAAIAFAGLLFATFGATAGGGFTAALALAALVALAAVPVAFRVEVAERG
jgi:MFS family permease